MIDVDFITINTDGGSSNNPGPAGIGIVFQFEDKVEKYHEFIGDATNNIAEYTAILFD